MIMVEDMTEVDHMTVHPQEAMIVMIVMIEDHQEDPLLSILVHTEQEVEAQGFPDISFFIVILYSNYQGLLHLQTQVVIFRHQRWESNQQPPA